MLLERSFTFEVLTGREKHSASIPAAANDLGYPFLQPVISSDAFHAELDYRWLFDLSASSSTVQRTIAQLSPASNGLWRQMIASPSLRCIGVTCGLNERPDGSSYWELVRTLKS